MKIREAILYMKKENNIVLRSILDLPGLMQHSKLNLTIMLFYCNDPSILSLMREPDELPVNFIDVLNILMRDT